MNWVRETPSHRRSQVPEENEEQLMAVLGERNAEKIGFRRIFYGRKRGSARSDDYGFGAAVRGAIEGTGPMPSAAIR